MIKQHPVGNGLLSVGGGFIMVFSVVMGLIILFVIPGGCSFVGSLQLIILGFLFVGGVLTFFLGVALSWKKRKAEAGG